MDSLAGRAVEEDAVPTDGGGTPDSAFPVVGARPPDPAAPVDAVSAASAPGAATAGPPVAQVP